MMGSSLALSWPTTMLMMQLSGWCGWMVLCHDAVLNFLEWKAKQLLHSGSFPLELLSFPCKAWCVNEHCAYLGSVVIK